MPALSGVEVAKIAQSAGWSGWPVVTAVAVARAESGWNPHAVNVVDTELRADGTPNPAFPSLDLGLFQINTFWWPGLSVGDALDPAANARHAFGMWKASFDRDPGRPWTVRIQTAWKQWVAYSSGAHKRYEYEALLACREAGIGV